MSEQAKHTPGPWAVHLNPSPSGRWMCPSEHGAIWGGSIRASDKITIVSVSHSDSDAGESIANYHLIAAAPELLKALEQIADCGSIREAEQIAMAAIAIAKGEA